MRAAATPALKGRRASGRRPAPQSRDLCTPHREAVALYVADLELAAEGAGADDWAVR